MPTVVVAARVDAAAHVQVDVADVVKLVDVGKALGDVGCDGDGARVRQRAQVTAGARDHVGQQADVRCREACVARGVPQAEQVGFSHPRQHQVLVVRDARFTAAVAVGQVGGQVQLLGARVARRLAGALDRQRDGAQAGQLVRMRVALEPALEGGGRVGGGLPRGRAGGARLHTGGGDEARGHAVEFGLRNEVRVALNVIGQDVRELLHHVVDEALAFRLDEDFDARLVQVVAPAVLVVDAHDGLDEDEDLLPRQELADHGADDRRAAHAAAHQHLEADLAGVVVAQLQADVVPGSRGAVFRRARHGDLELARQEGELGVQRAPLAQHFAVGARVDQFIGGHPGEAVAGGVADAVAAGLDTVHVDGRERVHHVGAALERDPVELDVLARREVAEAAALGGKAGVDVVVLAGDAGQAAQLRRVELAVGHGHAQHRRVALHVPAVLQAQRAEVFVGQLALEVALQLVAVLRRALVDEVFVELGVLVHGNRMRSIDHFEAGRHERNAQQRAHQLLGHLAGELRAEPDARDRARQ